MIEENIIHNVTQSYGRCALTEKFLDDFYDNFLKSSERIAPLFANTDFTRQKEVLKSTISFVIMFAKDEQNQFSRNKLTYVGKIHSKSELNISPDLYPFWVNSLIKTVEKHDEKYTNELGENWKKVMEPAITFLISLYDS